MKKISIFCVIFAFAIGAFADHIIYLKNGDKLKGSLNGGKKDSVFFKFMGNNLHLAQDDITAIYLDEYLAPEKICDPAGVKDAKIKGAVVDNFTRDNSVRPDVGAKVWVVQANLIPQFDIALVDTFLLINDFRYIYQQYANTNAQVPEDVLVALAMYNADTDTKFDDYCNRTLRAINFIKNHKRAFKATCDSKGVFNLSLKSGEYYILVVSANTQGFSSVEIDGKIYCKKLNILPDEELVHKITFEIF
ncbi:MAG: hypothetical protein J6V30_04565 [Paludibacteraceae bacterium]|nr:hypothetical protein [Paludibacteraceae bacterium]